MDCAAYVSNEETVCVSVCEAVKMRTLNKDECRGAGGPGVKTQILGAHCALKLGSCAGKVWTTVLVLPRARSMLVAAHRGHRPGEWQPPVRPISPRCDHLQHPRAYLGHDSRRLLRVALPLAVALLVGEADDDGFVDRIAPIGAIELASCHGGGMCVEGDKGAALVGRA